MMSFVYTVVGVRVTDEIFGAAFVMVTESAIIEPISSPSSGVASQLMVSFC